MGNKTQINESLILEDEELDKNQISGEDYIDIHLKYGTGIHPLVINGEAGMGKTVAIHNLIKICYNLNTIIDQNELFQNTFLTLFQ